MTQIEDFTYSPWKETTLLDGTDGMQFQPDLQKGDTIAAFVNDLSRNIYFDYASNDEDSYPGIDNYIFEIQTSMMYNVTKNPANENF